MKRFRIAVSFSYCHLSVLMEGKQPEDLLPPVSIVSVVVLDTVFIVLDTKVTPDLRPTGCRTIRFHETGNGAVKLQANETSPLVSQGDGRRALRCTATVLDRNVAYQQARPVT